MKWTSLIVGLCVGVNVCSAQNIDDLLRITSTQSGFASARSGALGSAFIGISDDATAPRYNPAGLSLLRFREFDAGLQMFRVSQDASYFGEQSSSNEHSFQPAFLAIAAPLKIGQLKAGYGLLVNNDEDYRNSRSYSAFNPLSSIVPSMLADGNSQVDNLLYKVHVADIINNRLVSPVRDSLQQSATINEDGSKNSLLVSFGTQITDGFSVGLTLGSVTHHLTYTRSYSERDVNNKYNALDTSAAFSNLDLNSLSVVDRLEQDASAFYIRLGLLATLGDWGRFSLAMSPPLSYDVRETFSREVTSTFDDNPSYPYTATNSGHNEYNVYSPWDLAVGFSANVAGFTGSISARYQDFNSAHFSSEQSYLAVLNDSIHAQLREQFEWSAAVEYKIPTTPLFLRGSVTSANSVYAERFTTEGSITTVGAGFGVVLNKKIRLDAMARFSSTKGNYTVYGDGSDASYSLTTKPSVYALQFSYRY